jgi:dihydrofolate synthase/folylpolyglutamate synthase
LTAAAWAAFGRAGVDVAVLETGLGGRLDSTNATDVKWATVLTSVGLEHVDVLGGTLDAIAREKAAIARRGVPMFSAVRRGTEAGDAAAEVCRQAGAPFHALGEDFAVVNVAPDGEGLRAAVRCGARVYAGLRLPTPARYQAENLALAVAVVDNLAARGLVPEAARALSPAFAGNDLRIPGRFEVVPGRPTVLLDGAHTAESLTALFESVDAAFPERRRVAVVGVSRDKDLQRLSSAFLGRVDLVIATRAPTPRAADATAVAAALARVGVDARAAADAQEALTSAVSAAGAGGLVVVTGSLYLVAAAQAILHPTESNP